MKQRLAVILGLALGMAAGLGAWRAWQAFSVYTVEGPAADGAWTLETRKKWGAHRDQPHGEAGTWWWEGGPRKLEGGFRHGRRHGVWTYWDDSGQLRRQELWRADVLQRVRDEPPWWKGKRDQAP